MKELHELLNQKALKMAVQDEEIPGVLFMCVHNAGRSQMAAGFLKHATENKVKVFSAGSKPNICKILIRSFPINLYLSCSQMEEW